MTRCLCANDERSAARVEGEEAVRASKAKIDCGQKQAGRVWNKHLVDKLINRAGFKQSKTGECAFCKGNVLCVLHTDIMSGLTTEKTCAEKGEEDK